MTAGGDEARYGLHPEVFYSTYTTADNYNPKPSLEASSCSHLADVITRFLTSLSFILSLQVLSSSIRRGL